MKSSLQNLFALSQSRMDKMFALYLKSPCPAPLLQEAMAYTVLNGGKRIRPLLVYATGQALEANIDNLDAAACAIELIHSYSLIHDDLPAMDNADLRRGKPACHKAYSEALAILAGDALQSLAFQILAEHPATTLSAAQRLAMITTLSTACGPNGIAAGQTLDITIMNKTISLEELTLLYKLKTGALLTASIELGMLGSISPSLETRRSLQQYAECIGLAFQIQDDLLDIEGNTILLGKPQGLDAINNKVTYPLLLGVDQARYKVEELFDNAMKSIVFLEEKAEILIDVAEYLLWRKQ
jgi:geranylgeranyl pyrophosphate synthase